jgi:hypothetical protein
MSANDLWMSYEKSVYIWFRRSNYNKGYLKQMLKFICGPAFIGTLSVVQTPWPRGIRLIQKMSDNLYILYIKQWLCYFLYTNLKSHFFLWAKIWIVNNCWNIKYSWRNMDLRRRNSSKWATWRNAWRGNLRYTVDIFSNAPSNCMKSVMKLWSRRLTEHKINAIFFYFHIFETIHESATVFRFIAGQSYYVEDLSRLSLFSSFRPLPFKTRKFD